MEEIPMVDLKTQYHRLKSEIDSAVLKVLESTAFIKGPEVKKFESNLAAYLGAKHVIGCANGTDALQIAMMALGYQPGDEVITASFTYIATAEVIALLRLKPVLVEVNKDTFTIDPAAIEAAITPKTRAIVPVHLFGQAADMEAIMKIAAKYNLDVIEDNAQAIGADYIFADGARKKLGTIGTVGCTSFFPSKNLGAYGDGGALYTDNDALAAKIKKIANHGQSSLYIHDEVGVNSRLDTIQAAVLDVKLKYLNDFAASRQQAADYYDAAFKDLKHIQTPVRAPWSTHVFHQYTVILNNMNRDEVQKKLAAKGISSKVYYPIPVHLQKAYADERYHSGAFPITESLAGSVLSLPIHTEFTKEQLKYIVESFCSIIQSL
ncbi:MAG TPA: DegT/DnrJ/EryC1/StrS family aminotransferase [Chitinophagales bacterium]|nr:DegT/DnrJ/EryC1/StrS family aminotransferase [Chitinophagales bacterium]